MIFRMLISIAAVLLIACHLTWPTLSIDFVSILLIVIAMLPWLGTLFKAVELPGGFKFEYRNLEKLEGEIKDAGLLSQKNPGKDEAGDIICKNHPTLRLAFLRIEIEKRIRKLADKNGVPSQKGLRFTCDQLREAGILSAKETSALHDPIGTLNQAVHGIELREDIADWASIIGPNVLASLDIKLQS